MKTITLQVGNSDDKLTQKEWAAFVSEITSTLKDSRVEMHFFACSAGDAPWQNAAWVFEASAATKIEVQINVRRIRRSYRQDSAAWTEGTTTFI